LKHKNLKQKRKKIKIGFLRESKKQEKANNVPKLSAERYQIKIS